LKGSGKTISIMFMFSILKRIMSFILYSKILTCALKNIVIE